MGREIRIQYENAWYHVMNRAAGRKFIFSDENNKYIFFELIDEVYKKYAIEIHAYCLMDSHYHLLIKTPNANLSKAMHYLQFMFSKTYNKIRCSDDPIFKSRYKSILVKNEAYLSQVCRYIHLNPVEANLARGVDYTWSSYRYYINNSQKPYWLNTNILSIMISNFKAFHKEGSSNKLKNFYRKSNYTKIVELELNLDEVHIGLAELHDLTINTISNKNLSKFVFCFAAKYIYDYDITIISYYLGYSSRNTIASLLHRNKSKINSDMLSKLNELKNNPQVLVKYLCRKLEYH